MKTEGFRRRVALGVNDRLFYGWVMLVVAALGIFASGPGQSHTISVFVGPLVTDLGISATAVSFAYGSATLVAAFCLPFVGRMVDRHGMRMTAFAVTLFLSAACFGFSQVSGTVIDAFGLFSIAVWLTVGFAAVRFFGQGALMLNCANLVSQWFVSRRGFAMGLMALGFSASMAVHPPLVEWLIATIGWRDAWLVLGIVTLALLLPPVLFLVVNKPEDIDLLPDGRSAETTDGTRNEQGARQGAEFGLTLGEALRTSTFYICCCGFTCLSMLVTMLHFFQISIFEAQGLSRDVAARIFPVSAIAMVLFMPVMGRLLDRFPTERMLAGGLCVMAAALIAAANVTDLTSGIIYGIVFGANNAVSMTFFGYLWPRYFGRKHIGSIQGTAQMVGVVGASIGPLPLGVAYDLTGDYTATLLGAAVLPLTLAVVSVLFLREPRLPQT